MSDSDVNSADPGRLAELLRISEQPKADWQPADLDAILRHQLAAPLQLDLKGFKRGYGGTLPAPAAEDEKLKTFRGLLLHPKPPLDLLKLTKDSAKSNRTRPESPLPAEIATLLYFASIAAGLVRLESRITDLDDAGLSEGFAWCRKQPWLDAELRPLFEAALDRIAHHKTSPPKEK